MENPKTDPSEKGRKKFWGAGLEAVDEADRLILSNRWLIIVVFFIGILLIVQFWTFSRLSDQLVAKIQLPPYDGSNDFSVGLNDADDKYFFLMGEYIIKRASNFTPETVEGHLNEATQFMTRSIYIQNKNTFEKFIKSVKTNQIRQTFEPILDRSHESIKRLKGNQVEFKQKGTAFQKIGKITTLQKDCEYTVILYREGGKTHEEGLSTTCFDGSTTQLSE